MSIKQLWRLLKQSFAQWQRDRATLLAAALAYYTALSIAPVLVLIIAIAGFFLGQDAARGEILGWLQGALGESGAETVQTMLRSTRDRASGTVAALLSLGLLLFSASGVFNHLRESLNIIWNVDRSSTGGIKQALRKRILAFLMIPIIGFLLILSLAASAVLSGISNFALGPIQDFLPILKIVDLVVSFGVVTLLFASIYRILPDARVSWRDVWIGAGATSLLFMVGEWAIGLYLANSGTASAYGAAGSFVVLLLWIYYSSLILFFGAEFTQVYANRFGSRLGSPLERDRNHNPNSVTDSSVTHSSPQTHAQGQNPNHT